MQSIYGTIREVSLDKRIFTILIKKRIYYFCLSRSQQKRFGDYLQPGYFVVFNASDYSKLFQHCKVYEVYNFIKLFNPLKNKKTVYFDLETIKKGVRKLLNKDRYRLFLDMEFTMPPYDYKHGNGFVAEIIQYGAYLEDADGKVVVTENNMVKPASNIGLNTRTYSFLNINMKDFKNAQTPYQFYNTLNNLVMYYQPVIYVWGKNDILMLSKFYEMYKLKPLIERQQIVNLMQVMKNYYGIKTDIGLFNAYQLFGKKSIEAQDHNALHDACATADIFHLLQTEVSKS